MPQRYAKRPISGRGEVNLARRVERERKLRGWSYETLATEMTAAGCTITKAALYSIEKGSPPRRITVDELTAFAEIFTEGDVVEMLIPTELLDQRRAQQVIEDFQECMADFGRLASRMFTTYGEIFDIGYDDAELGEFVLHQLVAAGGGRNYAIDTKNIDPDGKKVAELALLRAIAADHEHQAAMRKAAFMWAMYRNGNWTAAEQKRAEKELAELRAALEAGDITMAEEDD